MLPTGWFGRGKVGSLGSQMYSELNKLYLSRPARKQKEYVDPKKYHMEGAQEYNIWYGRYIGDIADKMDREPATDRCKLETDAGFTKADLMNSNSAENSNNKKQHKRFFCIHFARGVCAKGSECAYYHRVPLPEDDARCEELFDCFGRQRHSKHKDDMSGVGSFMKPCRTLFIGNLLKAKYETPQALEDAMWRHFGEWGEVESINVIHRLSIAFPRYRLRTSAEFAKEAMACQKLDYDEIISIRWAHDDPNPVAKDSIERADKDAMFALLQAKGISLKPAEFEYPADYALPDAKRLKVEGEGGEIVAQHPQIAYPDTDGQYQASIDGGDFDPTAFLNAKKASLTASLTSSLLAKADETVAQATATANGAENEEEENGLGALGLMADYADEEEEKEGEGKEEDDNEEEEEEDGDGGGWHQYLDEATGAPYYFNSLTGESSWTPPTFDNTTTNPTETAEDNNAHDSSNTNNNSNDSNEEN